jgi:hypothetical protein
VATQPRLVAVITEALPLDSLGKLAKQYPDCSISSGRQGGFWVREAGAVCGCITCSAADADDYERLTGDLLFPLFVVCPDCGNKRCPKASHHDNACTGSNGAGQSGSVYS